jgi:hypothetical protein
MARNVSVGRSAGAVIIPLAVTALLFITGLHGSEERQSMTVSEPKSVIRTPIPPIDTEVPTVIETATFALG